MESRDSWIDRAEVLELIGEIVPGARGLPGKDGEFVPLPLLEDDDVRVAEDVSVGCDGEEPVGEATAERMAMRLQAVRARAMRSGLLVGSEPESVPAQAGELCSNTVDLGAFVLPEGRLVERAAALSEWLSGTFDEVFVLDELGDELVPGEVPAGLRSGAVRLAQSWERSQRWLVEDGLAAESPVAGAALADGRVLSVIGVRCSGGFYCAAVVGTGLVEGEEARAIADAVALVFG